MGRSYGKVNLVKFRVCEEEGIVGGEFPKGVPDVRWGNGAR